MSIGSSVRWLPEHVGRALQQRRTPVTEAARAQSTKTDVGVQATPMADAAWTSRHFVARVVCMWMATCFVFFCCCAQVFVGSFLHVIMLEYIGAHRSTLDHA